MPAAADQCSRLEPIWNDSDRGNWRSWRNAVSSATVTTTNVTCTDLGSNPGLRCARTARWLQLEYQHHILNMAAPVEGTVSLSSVELAQICMWTAPNCRYTSHHTEYCVCVCGGANIYIIIIIISNLSNDRSKASSKTIPPHSAIKSFLLQLTVSSPVLKVIQ